MVVCVVRMERALCAQVLEEKKHTTLDQVLLFSLEKFFFFVSKALLLIYYILLASCFLHIHVHVKQC